MRGSDFSCRSATRASVRFCIVVNMLCQAFTLECALTPTPTPTFISIKSSAFILNTSSGEAPSKIQIKQEQNPFVISESLSTANLAPPNSSKLTSSHTSAVHPGTRFAGTRDDSSNGGRSAAYSRRRLTRSIGSARPLNSEARLRSLTAARVG